MKSLSQVNSEAAGDRRQTRLLVAMLASLVGAALIFLGVVTGVTDSFDATLFQAAHGLPDDNQFRTPTWFREAIRDVTALGSAAVLSFAVVIVAAYLIAMRRYWLAVLLTASAVFATFVSTMFKLAMDRARPSLVEHAVETFSASFPSGHALLTAAIILPMAALLADTVDEKSARRVIVVSGLLVTFTVGVSRVYLGVHWPTDVLAGWCFGTFWASATLLAARSSRPSK